MIKRRSVKFIFIIILLTFLIWICFLSLIYPPTTTRVNPLNNLIKLGLDHTITYLKSKDRKFPHQQLFMNFETYQVVSDISSSENGCPQWIVNSANHIPLKAVGYFKSLVDKDSNWCCVTVLYKQSIELEYEPLKSDRFIVLTLEDQVKLVNTTSDNSRYALKTKMSGKNIGYLYAISHGAKLIYDTREDARLDFPQIPLLGDYKDYVLISKEDHLHKSWEDFVIRAPDSLWRHGFYYPGAGKLDEYFFLKEKKYDCAHFDIENIKILNMVETQLTLQKEKTMVEERIQLALYKGMFWRVSICIMGNYYIY